MREVKQMSEKHEKQCPNCNIISRTLEANEMLSEDNVLKPENIKTKKDIPLDKNGMPIFKNFLG